MQQEYKPFDRVKVYREVMETIKTGPFCQQRFMNLFSVLKIGSGKKRKIPETA